MAYDCQVPVTWTGNHRIVDTIHRDCRFGKVVEQVVQVWMGSIGRNGRNKTPPAMENMLPKFELVPIIMYLRMLAKVRRPSRTASASTLRSLRRRIMQAASFATSTAVSTEKPILAACSGGASLMPSPI